MTDSNQPTPPVDAFRTVVPQQDNSTSAGATAPGAMDDFDELELIGQGGMGVVYRARQRSLDRLVALKVIVAGPFATAEVRARFQREAESVARLKHPNILQIHAIGESTGSPYLALEYVAGGSLRERLDGRPYAPRESAELVATLADAVEHAHQRGVVHRDLKPANVLLEPDGTPKIADFGLAKHLADDDSQTRTGEIVGTPAYMAPEQAGSDRYPVGPACDVYALGAILYELLTGRPPFQGQDSIDTVLMVLSDEPVVPRRLVPKLPVDLETICLKCLEKDPCRRYASAGDLAADLSRYLEGRPILARPASSWERLSKWVRRRPAVASLIAVSVLAVVVLLTGGILFQLRLQHALTRARHNLQQAQDSVDQMLLDVSVERLAPLPQSEELRRELLQSAARFCATFLSENPTDPAVREQAGRARRQLADINQLLGDTAAAEADYGEAIALLSPFGQRGSIRPVAGREWAAAHNNLANLLERRGDVGGADTEYRAAISALERVDPPVSTDPRAVLTLVAALDNLGVLRLGQGDMAAALELNQRALAALAANVSSDRRIDPEFQLALARARINRGVLAMAQGEPRQAEEAFEAAVGLLAEPPADRVANPQRRQTLALARLNLGIALATDPLSTAAEPELAAAVTELAALSADFPAVVGIQQSLGRARNTLGEFLHSHDQLDAAAEALEAARDQHEQLAERHEDEPAFRLALVTSLDRLGKVYRDQGDSRAAERATSEALRVGETLANEFPERPDVLSQLASACATAASLLERRDDLGAARRYLHEAVRYQEAAVDRDEARLSFRLQLRQFYVALGDVLVRLAEPSDAAQVAERIAALLPEDWNGYLQAAALLADCTSVVTGVKGDQPSPVEGESLSDYCARRAAELAQAGLELDAIAAEEALADEKFSRLRQLDDAEAVEPADAVPTPD